jgi:hypothetical protein
MKNFDKKSTDEIVDIYSNSFNCNLKEKQLIKCFSDFDKKWFFRAKKFKECNNLDLEFKNCLIYSNNNKFYKREAYNPANNKIEIYQAERQALLENKQNAYDYLTGKKTEEELLKATDNERSKKNKKIIEL